MLHSRSPDLTREGGAANASTFQRILLPIDFSPPCRHAVLTAAALQRSFGSEIYLLNIATFGQNTEFLASLGAPANLNEVLRDAKEHLYRYVADLVPDQPPELLTCTAEMDDDVVKGVCVAAHECDATCVILAVHEHKHRRLFRTRAERIANALHCAVLIEKAPPEPVVHYD